MVEQVDLSVLEYAQYHKLARDHLAEPIPFLQIKALVADANDDLTDDSNLPQIEVSPLFTTDERLTVDRGAAALLADANGGLYSTRLVESSILSLLNIRHTKKLRVELPLLRTDNESDLRSFATWKEPGLKSIRQQVPMEPVDDEKDEGLGWPSALIALPEELVKEIKSEKIEVSKETLLTIQNAIKDDWTEKDDFNAWKNSVSYKRMSTFDPLTPPLLPTSPPSAPSSISSSAYHLPLLSDSDSLISKDLQALEERIFEQDKLVAPHQGSSDTLIGDDYVGLGDISRPATSEIDFGSPINTRTKLENLKVEVPLLHSEPAFTLPKVVTFSEVIEEMRIDPLLSEIDEGSTRQSTPVDTFFKEAFGDAADRAHSQITQEQLLEADTTARVAVPPLDFSPPEPPWHKFRQMSLLQGSLKAQRAMILEVLKEYGPLPLWPGVKKLEQTLRWSPFPLELGKVNLNEELGSDETFRSFLIKTKDSDVVDSKGLTWKPPGLRILKDIDEDDEEIEYASFAPEPAVAQGASDLAALVQKRKFALTKIHDDDGGKISKAGIKQKIKENKPSDHNPKDRVKAGHLQRASKAKTETSLLDDSFSTMKALDNFLELRGSKKQKLIGSSYFPAPKPPEEAPKQPSQIPNQNDNIAPIQRLREQDLPAPTFEPPSTTPPFIVSSSIIQQKSLMRSITNLLPNGEKSEIIERDFTAHNTTTWLNPNSSVTRSPVISPLAAEADIILSPSTGLILTFLTKIKQKPLPGQKNQTAIRSKIEKASSRFERLVVLVSEGASSNDGIVEPLDGSSTVALCEFIGFCGSLETPTCVYYVSGGEASLGRWIVALLMRYGVHEPGIALLDDETHWELFLRRLGMNAFAAQTVISELKAPEGLDSASLSKMGLFGISAFVEMDREERLRRFAGLVGGRRVLERVSDVLDMSWT